MIRLVYFGFFFGASLGIAQAQEPVFWVLYGQYQVGKTFLPSDSIRSKDDITPIILIAKTQGFVILRERGAWQADKLWAMLQEKAKYEPFPELYVGKINPQRDKLLPFGNVERCPPPKTIACVPMLSQVIGIRNITFKWLSKNKPAHSLKLKNSFNDVLHETTQKDTTFTLDFAQYESETFFKLEVCQCNSYDSLEVKSCSIPLVFSVELAERPMREAEKKEYENQQNRLQTLPPALQQLHLACWLMQKQCYLEAFLACQEARKSMPQSKVLYFVLGEWLAHHAYHYHTLEVYPRWRFML